MRYRDVRQPSSSRGCSLRWREDGDEGTTVLSDATDGGEELTKRRDERDLWKLSSCEQALIERTEPWILANRGKRRHPELGAEPGVAEGCEAGADGLALARVLEARHDADVRSERLDGAEAGDVAE